MKTTEEGYLEKTPLSSWTLDGFCDWCASDDRFASEKKKMLDYIKRSLVNVTKSGLIPVEMRQRATELLDQLKKWKTSRTKAGFFTQLENKRKLSLIEGEKAVELAEIERMKVTQLRTHVHKAVNIHQNIAEDFEETSKKQVASKRKDVEGSNEHVPVKKNKIEDISRTATSAAAEAYYVQKHEIFKRPHADVNTDKDTDKLSLQSGSQNGKRNIDNLDKDELRDEEADKAKLLSNSSDADSDDNSSVSEKENDDEDETEDTDGDVEEHDLPGASVDDDGLSRAVVDAIKKARHHSSGKTSPMYYGVLDLRPRSLTDYTDIRAADLLPKDHLPSVRSRLEVAKSSLFDPAESVCKLLEAMQKLPAKSLVEICERMRVDGATGLLRRLVEVISVASVHRSDTLSELLKEESSKGSGSTDNVPGIDAATAVGDLKSVDPEDKEIQWVFHAIDETSSLSILSTSIRVIRSGFLETNITERDIDMNLLKQFFDSLWDVTHLHYGEGESRASRNRRASIKSGGNVGDRFDWLISCYSTFPDDVRGIEFGVVENSGPNQVDGMEKVRADIVKVIKTARDQLLEIIRKVRIMYGADHLPQDIEHGIKALFIVALHVVGLNVRAYVVYWLGGNVFAVAELGSARLPHSLESIHNALKFCRLVLRMIISRSIRLVDILFTEIKLSPAGSPPRFDQWQVPDMQTSVKQCKLKLSK
ncbi:hypothetical protein BC938DRAFT_480029 [Jimgerdemannia flammicorona]|uniref:Uncharacterized protein n=1 Tax=Jimgerdemannia flammicorona TaxID=994334 RepID=A0A433QJL2_9FUNG|nr:hypothetical protein BC938DRAFT_480029 [Jimgerdemannia flammicorona]